VEWQIARLYYGCIAYPLIVDALVSFHSTSLSKLGYPPLGGVIITYPNTTVGFTGGPSDGLPGPLVPFRYNAIPVVETVFLAPKDGRDVLEKLGDIIDGGIMADLIEGKREVVRGRKSNGEKMDE